MGHYPHLYFSSDGYFIRMLEGSFHFLLETFGSLSIGQRGVRCDNLA